MSILDTLGPDTVELVRRLPVVAGDPPAPVLDAWGRPTRADHPVTKSGVSWLVTTGTEEIAGASIAVLNATGLLTVDTDTQALTQFDAVRFDGRLFELTTPGVKHVDGFGRPSHVRVYSRWCEDASLGEAVTIVPAGARVDGVVQPDGDPIPVIARAVFPGNATIRLGGEAATIEADYTVVFDLDAPISNDDWLIVRGAECRVVIERQESQWTARRQLVALAKFKSGGV